MLKKISGITLVELLVVLVLSSLLMAAFYRLFIAHQYSYAVQEQVVDTQQNVRAAMDLMTREIRMAGYRKDILSEAGNVSGFTQIVTPVNDANSVGSHDDQITVVIADQAISYWLQMAGSIPVLVRDDHTGAGPQLVAECIEKYLPSSNVERLDHWRLG